MKKSLLLPIANFLAAIGGGIILSAGIGTLRVAFIEGSLLAFFGGAVIGLIILRLLPQNRSRFVLPWFSFAVGFSSLLLFELFRRYAVNQTLNGLPEVFLIVLLTIRFGLWFFSRAVRAQILGTENQGIALIELGYYTGVAVGLMTWGVLAYGMLTALLVDAVMQVSAGLIDLITIRTGRDGTNSEQTRTQQPVRELADHEFVPCPDFDYRGYRRLTIAVLCLTVGFQAVAFNLTNWVPEESSKAYVLACFYVGVAASALTCRVFKVKFDWSPRSRRQTMNATLSSETARIRIEPSFGVITFMAAIPMIMALSAMIVWQAISLVLVFTAISAFIYQILVLSLLDYIGRAERIAKISGMIIRTYLLVAIGTILSIAILGGFQRNYAVSVALTLLCCAISVLAVRDRHAERHV